MNTVQPIREVSLLEVMKAELMKIGHKNYILFVLGINTGLRISDILNLRVKDVRDCTHISLKEKKTGKDKRFKINSLLKYELDKYIINMEMDDFLIHNQNNRAKAISRVQAYRILNNTSKRLGISEVGTHTLRKTFGYHFYKKTKDIALLQELFNHSSPSITLRYIGINQQILDDAIDDFSL